MEYNFYNLAYKSFGGNVCFTVQFSLLGEMSFWGKCLWGKCLLGEMSFGGDVFLCLFGELSFGGNVFWGNCLLGETDLGEMSRCHHNHMVSRSTQLLLCKYAPFSSYLGQR